MSKEIFNPRDSKYNKVEDLPKDERDNFVNSEDGFIRKEAKKEMDDAQKIVELARQFKEAGIEARELLMPRRKSRVLEEVGGTMEDNNSAMDILEERAIEDDLKPADVLKAEAAAMHDKKYPELAYLEKLRNNPEVLTGFPRHIWQNRKFVLEAVKLNKKALGKLRHGLYGDLEITSEAVKHDGLALQYAADSLKENRDVVLEAVKQNPMAIKYASKKIKEALRKVMQI